MNARCMRGPRPSAPWRRLYFACISTGVLHFIDFYHFFLLISIDNYKLLHRHQYHFIIIINAFMEDSAPYTGTGVILSW